MTKAALLFLSTVLAAISSGAFAQSALKQLQDAASGNQSTGKTFDNNNRPQQMDAYPKGNTNVPSVSGTAVSPSTGTAAGYDVGRSSGTAGGYDVGRSSGTASGTTATAPAPAPRRTGTETTKKP
jgi:hypothetical protein